MADTNRQLFEDNLSATKELTDEVHTLSGRLSAKELLHKRVKRLGIVGIIISVISLISAITSGVVAYKFREIAEENQNNAKVQCLNANESRKANRQIWTLVVQQSSRTKNRTPKDIDNTKAFQDYIDRLYAQRDCNDLNRRYKIPDPPKFRF